MIYNNMKHGVMYCVLLLKAMHLVKSEDLPACEVSLEQKGLSEKEKQASLKLHNTMREKIRLGHVKGLPKAKKMPPLVWDKQLEEEALRWAKLCPDYRKGFSHPHQSWKKMSYSQNMAWGHLSIQDGIQEWFDEYKDYVEKGVNPLIFRSSHDKVRLKHNLGQIGHFTAMVNAKSTKMGCAKVASQELTFRVIYACNYSPPGNIIIVSSNGNRVKVPAYEIKEPEGSKSAVNGPNFRKLRNQFRRRRKETKNGYKKEKTEVISCSYGICNMEYRAKNTTATVKFQQNSGLDTSDQGTGATVTKTFLFKTDFTKAQSSWPESTTDRTESVLKLLTSKSSSVTKEALLGYSEFQRNIGIFGLTKSLGKRTNPQVTTSAPRPRIKLSQPSIRKKTENHINTKRRYDDWGFWLHHDITIQESS